MPRSVRSDAPPVVRDAALVDQLYRIPDRCAASGANCFPSLATLLAHVVQLDRHMQDKSSGVNHMSDAIAALSDAMRNDAETLRVIGQNVANMETMAYRREIAVMRPSFDQVDRRRARRRSRQPPTLETAIDLRPGTLKSTSEALHLALEGPGFFVVDTPQGEALTRRGDFRLDNEGRLVTQAGLPVLGEGGRDAARRARRRSRPTATVRVERRDRRAAAHRAGGVRIAAHAARRRPVRRAPNYPKATTPRACARDSSRHRTWSRCRRWSGSSRPCGTSRAVQRFVRGYDDMMGKAISELGKV